NSEFAHPSSLSNAGKAGWYRSTSDHCHVNHHLVRRSRPQRPCSRSYVHWPYSEWVARNFSSPPWPKVRQLAYRSLASHMGIMASVQRTLCEDDSEGFQYKDGILSADQERTLIALFERLPFREFEFRGFLGKRRPSAGSTTSMCE